MPIDCIAKRLVTTPDATIPACFSLARYTSATSAKSLVRCLMSLCSIHARCTPPVFSICVAKRDPHWRIAAESSQIAS